ncbi:MAG: cytochrome c [Wenzhouxiangella sp.]|nr:cytochrome c [Wenzhouxiangella sp.]MCH8477789.1 cytochrome c [Wenzhouxiangella sp.]
MRYLMLCLIAVAVVATSLAFASPSVEDQIKARQSAYTFMGWNMNRIRAQVIDGDVEFNAGQVQAAANAIAAIANSGMSAMFGPDTTTGTGWKPTRLRPEFFEDMARTGEIAGNFIREANALAEAAESGDRDAIARQFRATADSCGACHRPFRASE